METLHIETRREAADRLAIAATLKLEHDYKTRVAQELAADAILSGARTVEHVTLWTDNHGRSKHENRTEALS